MAGYTSGMKTAISIPDEVFQAAELLAKQTCKSRSQLFAEAMAEYLVRHAPERVTASLDQALEQLGEETDPFVAAAARNTLRRDA